MLRDKLYKTWHNQKQDWGVEILEGQYKGLIVHIKDLSLDDNTNQLSIDYQIIYKPGSLSWLNENNDSQFGEFFGSVMNDVVGEAINIYKARTFNF